MDTSLYCHLFACALCSSTHGPTKVHGSSIWNITRMENLNCSMLSGFLARKKTWSPLHLRRASSRFPADGAFMARHWTCCGLSGNVCGLRYPVHAHLPILQGWQKGRWNVRSWLCEAEGAYRKEQVGFRTDKWWAWAFVRSKFTNLVCGLHSRHLPPRGVNCFC